MRLQGQGLHPFRRLAHHLKGREAPHGVRDEMKTAGRRGQRARRHAGDRVVRAVVGMGDVASGEGRQDWRPEIGGKKLAAQQQNGRGNGASLRRGLGGTFFRGLRNRRYACAIKGMQEEGA